MAGEMRRRLIDHARRRLASKRGSGAVHEQISTSTTVVVPAPPEDIEAVLARLDKALVELSAKFPRTAHVVQLRFLVGFTTEEAATELGLSPATVKREWTFARAWLAAAMETPTETASRQP
jgi:RNA polymerase sigma factor (TIGR02999 family)